MATTISKLSVILEGSTGGLTASMREGGRSVVELESQVHEAGSHIAEILGGLGVGLSIEGISEYLKGSAEAITSNGRLSDSLGISTQALGRLQYAASLAGVGNEELDGGLKKMLKSLSDAEQGTGTAGKAFDQLGLNVKDLVNVAPDKAFALIGDKLKEIQNPAERVGATMEIFGKQGASLLPILTKGSEKLGEMGAEADKFGASLSRVDTAQVEVAEESFKRLEGALSGAANQLVVHLAPYVSAVADKLTSMGEDGQGAAKYVVDGFESVVKAVAAATDYLNILTAGWQLLRAGASFALGSILDVLGLVVGGIEWLYNKVTGTSTHIGEGMQAVAQGLLGTADDAFKQAGENWDKFIAGDNSKAASRMFRGIEEDSHKAAQAIADDASKSGGAFDDLAEQAKKVEAVTKKLAELHKAVEDFAKTKGEKAASDIAAIGGNAQQQAEAAAAADQLDHLEAVKKAQQDMANDAKKMWDETRTPAEKYADEIDKINNLLKDGKIDNDTAAKEQSKAAAELDKAGGKADVSGPKLLEAGSQDAAKFVAEIQNKQKGEDNNKKLVENTGKQVNYLKTIADHFSGGGDEQQFVGVSLV